MKVCVATQQLRVLLHLVATWRMKGIMALCRFCGPQRAGRAVLQSAVRFLILSVVVGCLLLY